MLKKNQIIVGALFLLSFLFFSPINAFSISPLKYTLSLGSGDDKDLIVNVKNDSNIKLEYQAVIMGVQQDNLGRPIFKPSTDIAESWVKFSDEKIVLNSNESKDVVFTITIPKNAPPGAHYLGIGVRESGVQKIGGQLMTIVILQVAGTVNETLLLEKFTSIKKYFFDKKLTYFLQVKNTGNIDLSLKARIEVYNFRNQIVDSNIIDLGNKLFVQSNRSTEIHPSSSDKMFLPGRYRSLILINYGLTNQQIVGSVSFWYWPVWFLILVGVVTILILLFFLYLKNKHERM